MPGRPVLSGEALASPTFMNALEATALVLLAMLPLQLFVQTGVERLRDPRHIRNRGLALESDAGLERRGGIVGTYCGCAIHAEVLFMGMLYRFDRAALPAYRYCVGPRELYLEPGLVYVTQ